MAVIAGDKLVYEVAIVAKNTTGAVRKVVGDINSINRRTRRPMALVTKSFVGLRNAIGRTGKSLFAFTRRYTAMLTTIAGTALIFKSVSDAQKFGLGIAEIGTIFRGTAEELAAVEQALLGVSEQLGLQETIVAKGFYQIISSNITDAAEAMVVLDAATKLATVGLADVKDTIDVVTSVIKAYNTDVGEAARISDILFKTVVLGKITIPELAVSLGQVLPIAATLGIRLEEVTAAIATLTQGGIDPNTAVIQLRQAFNQLLKLTPVAQQTLLSYGLTVNAATLKNDGLIVTLGKIRAELGTNAVAYSKVFGNIRALIPVLALTGERWREFQQVLEETEDTTIGMDKALSRFLQNPFKRFQIFLNSLRLQLRKVGEAFIQEINKIIEARGGVKAIVDSLTAGFGGFEEFAKGVARSLDVVIEQIDIFSKSVGGIAGTRAIFSALGDFLGEVFQTIITGITTAIQVVAQALVELPTLIDGVVRRFKSAANDIQKIKNLNPLAKKQPLPFPDILPTESELKAAIAEQKARLERFARDRDRLQKEIAEGFDTGRQQRLLGDAKQGKAEAQRLGRQLRKELRDGLFIEDLSTTLERVIDTGAADDAADLLAKRGQGLKDAFGVLQDTIKNARAGLIKEGKLPFIIDLALNYQYNPAKAIQDAKDAVEDGLNRVRGQQIAAEVLALEVGIKFSAEPTSIDPNDVEPAIAEIRKKFAEATGLLLGEDLDEQNILEHRQRLEELLRTHVELRSQIDNTLRSQEIFNKELNKIGESNAAAELEAKLQTSADEAQRLKEEMQEATKAAQATALGFESFAQLYAELAGNIAIPLRVQLDLLDQIAEKERERIRLANERNHISDEDANELGRLVNAQLARDAQDAAIRESDFIGGLSLRLQQLKEDVRSAGEIGAQVAEDLQGSLQSAFTTGLQAAILGASDAFDQFRQALAQGIASAVANAIAESLVNQIVSKIVVNAATSAVTGGGNLSEPEAIGGVNPGGTTNVIERFASGGIPQRLTPRAAGGIKNIRTLAEIGESGPEAVVPLPGNNRAIPVEFRGRSGGGNVTNQNLSASLTLNVVSDDRMFTQRVAEQMPTIERMLASTLAQGANRSLQTAVRSANRGA